MLSSHSSSSQMPQLGAPQRSAQIFAHVAVLKIKSSVKIQPAPDLGKVIRVSLIFWKSSATQHEESRVQASGASKRTHTHLWRDCTVSRSWRGGGGFSNSEDDWQKMSGTTRQPHTDTQQADVRCCMIRRRADSQGRRRSGIFRELCHPLRLFHRLGPGTARTWNLFVLSVWLNKYLPTYRPNVGDLKSSYLLMFSPSVSSTIVIFQTQGLVRVTVFSTYLCCTEGNAQPSVLHTTGAWARVRYLRGERQTQDRRLHVNYGESVLVDLEAVLHPYLVRFLWSFNLKLDLRYLCTSAIPCLSF